jgi:hypothetical protein
MRIHDAQASMIRYAKSVPTVGLRFSSNLHDVRNKVRLLMVNNTTVGGFYRNGSSMLG